MPQPKPDQPNKEVNEQFLKLSLRKDGLGEGLSIWSVLLLIFPLTLSGYHILVILKSLYTFPHAESTAVTSQSAQPACASWFLMQYQGTRRDVWLSVKPTEYETHKELSQGASCMQARIWNFSLPGVGWLGQVTLSKSIHGGQEAGLQNVAVITQLGSFHFYPWTLGKWPHLDESSHL